MTDDSNSYRERARAELATAEASSLPNVRERSLRAADRWTQMADLADRAKAGRAVREADMEARRADRADASVEQ